MPRQAKRDATIKSLIETIDETPDYLHLDVTPSVLKLIKLGLPAARAVLDILDADDLSTRKRARRVLEGAVAQHLGWRWGSGFADPEKQEEFQRLLKTNGGYRAEASPRSRKAAIKKWRRWLEAQAE